jgi:tetratricopeptide (TPR) repeat protein
LGRIYLRKGFYNKAKAVYQAALAKDPNFIEIINDLGIIYFREKLYKKAEEQWEKALKLDPEFTPARKNLKKYKTMFRK